MGKWLLLFSAVTLMGASIATADNITIYDGRGYLGTGTGGENNETEPGMINNQSWDLEAFTLEGNNLGIVAGFDLKDGKWYDGKHIVLGDIFIDINEDAQFGTTQDLTIDNFGYEYAIKLNFTDRIYNVYKLNSNSILTSSYAYNSPESDPLALKLVDELKASFGTFTYTDFGESYGTYHNAIDGIDLSFLNPGTTFISHVTMSCGNDNLMGSASVPEPSSIGCLLLGLSLLAGAGLKRKYNRK
ncbi:MAG: PEP-CTERM sorting domain-containing protein [Chitinispirillaceae bacterium]|nr:PEP-CTERM sorting domain-containing protein [Chitinispirillaceae bacterium]